MSTQTVNIISDTSQLLKVPNKVLQEVVDKEILCIGSAVYEALQDKEDVLVLNIGLGTLSIDLIEMQCKFVPGKALKQTIKQCIDSPVDPLEFEIEQQLREKLLKICEQVL